MLVQTLRWGLLALFCWAGLPAADAADAAPEVTLRVMHFLGPKAPQQRVFMEPWGARVAAQSGGRIAVRIYPSMVLGGRAPDLYDMVREGRIDIVWTLAGYTPGKFPRVEVFELPFVHTRDAVATNLAIQDLYPQYLAEDFKEVHPILIHASAGQAFHMVERPIRRVEDLAGMVIRSPSRTGLWMLQELGAKPFGIPVPAVPIALSKGVVDGVLLPFEVVPPLKVQTLTSSTTTGPDDQRFGTAVFLFLMNQRAYQSLAPDLQAIIDQNSGANIAAEVGQIFMAAEEPGRRAEIEQGNQMITLPTAEYDRFRTATAPVLDRWVAEADKQGIDGEGMLAAARQAIARHSQPVQN